MRKFNLKRTLIYSLVLHVVLALGVLLPKFEFAPPKTETVTVELLPAPPEALAKKAPPKTDPQLKQIVEQSEKSINNEKPQKEAFLSRNDQTVLKETVAREHGEFRNAKDKKTIEAKKNAGAKKIEEKPVARKTPNLDDLLGTSPVAMLQHKEETDRRQIGDGEPGTKSAEASRTDDYLKNLEQSAETMLNTREFKYYTYYSRIRRQLSQYWEPKVRDKLTRMFRQGRHIASDQDHVTKLLIVLNDAGNLVKVQVLSESGVNDLDDAATEAFRSAAPFPNPPRGIVEQDGTVKIRWDFVLES